MKESESSSASNSDATSTSGQPTDPAKALPPPSEAEYLNRQAQEAKAAMGRAWEDLKGSLAQGMDVRKWTGKYPWIATGTALAAGLAAGYLLTPRDRDEAAEMWEKLKEKIAGSKEEPDAVYVEAGNGKAPKAEKTSFLSVILKEGIKAVMPLVTSMVGAAMGGAEAEQQGAQQPPPDVG